MKQLLNSAFVSYQELWRSRRVLSAGADNTLLDLHDYRGLAEGWCAIIGGETKSGGQVYIQGYII